MTYEQYLNEWVRLYRRGEIPSNQTPITRRAYEQKIKKGEKENGKL